MNDILAAIRLWQDPGTWQAVRELTALAAGFDEQCLRLAADSRLTADGTLKTEADRLRNCAADIRRQRSELIDEFILIERWVRRHRPELLEFVPTAEFSGEPADAIRDLRRLESRLLSGDIAGTRAQDAGRARTAGSPRRKVADVNALIRAAMESSDRATVEKYLFASADALAGLCDCNRKTVLKTEFWETRECLQAKFHREHSPTSAVRRRDN